MPASAGARVISNAPDAIVPSGSSPNAAQRALPSGSTMIRSRSMRSPTPAASASSTSAVAMPPSVGSCMACTVVSSQAISASGRTLSPGVLRKPRARRMTVGEMPSARSSASFSRAMMAAPSSGTPLVMTTASPTRAPPVVTRRSFSTSPSIVPAMIGRSRPCVTSVWPPTSATSSSSHAACSSAKSRSTDASVVEPAGKSSVARNHRGRAPRTAMSLALTWSAYQPTSAVANVIGSLVATRYRSPMSMTAASSPTRGPTTTRGSLVWCLSKIACSVSARSLPIGSDCMPNSVYTAPTRRHSDQELEQVGGQVVELGAPRLATEMGLDPLAQSTVGRLAEHRADPPLRLGADAHVRQSRGDVLGADEPIARQIDLVRDLEAVDVVVHRVEKPEPSIAALQSRDLSPFEDACLARPRTVDIGLDRRRDRPRAEEAAAGVSVGEARVRQVDPSGRVELPAFPGVAGRALGPRARELGDLAREPRRLDERAQREAGAGARAGQLANPATQAADHLRAGQAADAGRNFRIERAGDRTAARRADQIARRWQRLDGELEGAVIVGEPHRVREGVLVSVVHPALHHALVAVATLEERRPDHRELSSFQRLSLRLFVTTDTEENAIAAPARMGESSTPQSGYSAPAATGISTTL